MMEQVSTQKITVLEKCGFQNEMVQNHQLSLLVMLARFEGDLKLQNLEILNRDMCEKFNHSEMIEIDP